jgi:hypothetical protein
VKHEKVFYFNRLRPNPAFQNGVKKYDMRFIIFDQRIHPVQLGQRRIQGLLARTAGNMQ